MSMDGIFKGSPISDGLMVEALQRQFLKANPPTDTSTKIPSQDTAKMQQAAKPEISMSGALNVAQKVLGYSLMGIGIGAGAALLPITLPLGLLGAGIGFGVGKGIEKLMDGGTKKADAKYFGAAIGGSIGTLLTGGLVILGAILIDNLDPVNRARAAKNKPDIKQEKPEIKQKADVKVRNDKTTQASDPAAVKFLLDKTRESSESITSIRDVKYYETDLNTFDNNDKYRVNAGPNFNTFFEMFNVEIELRNKIGATKTMLIDKEKASESSIPQLKASLDEDLETLKGLVENTNTEFEKAKAIQT